MLASTPDLLRLLVVPVFAWAAWRDIRTRRLPNRLWAPLVLLGLVALAGDLLVRLPLASPGDTLFLLRVAISLGFVLPLAYVFWRLGAFGGADAKALMTLAVVFPTFPTYALPVASAPTVPLQPTALGVFSMTILTNTVVVALAYPVALAARNLLAGDVAPVMFLGRRVRVRDLPTLHGRLFEDREGTTRSGLDLDALRMYLRWRGVSLADLRADAATLRDPTSVGTTYPPTDGAVGAGADRGSDHGSGVATDGSGRAAPARAGANRADGSGVGGVDGVDASDVDGIDGVDDPWAAQRFLDDIDGSAYGTTSERLREGLAVVADRETVWISPGLPFVVPMFVGLLLALTYGDLLFGALGLVGLV
ncbi:prepilin peptidase [Halobium salinum]|uniref:Prepilin peptidase n=1 Tax=Halobium salinum TaxID=1364940 RepID=A0ABD5PFW8_9EURY|nr:A24 family peptidase [Halobium salinum]